MKIILDNIIFQLQISGGISNYWYQLISHIIQKENYETFFFDDTDTDNIFRNLLDLKAFPKLGRQNLPLGRYINPKLANETEKAIFHSSYYRTSQNKNHISITTVHDFTYEHFIRTPSSIAHKLQKKQAILNSEGIICISQNTKKDLLKFIPAAKDLDITVIPHGVSSETFFELSKEDKDAHQLTKFPTNGYLLYVGDRKSAYKNFDKAVETSMLANIPLVILGGGPLSTHEREVLTKNRAENHYEHFGKVDNFSLNWFYNNAFALLYPSAYEGFGLPVIEAQMAGCPVIALNASSIPEVAGNAAILVKENEVEQFTQAVHQLTDENLRAQLRSKGFQNASKFTWKNTFDLTAAFYANLYKR